MKQIRVISDSDWEVLKRLVASNQNLLQSPVTRPSTTGQYLEGDDSMSPEVYIALPPVGGIPGLDSVASGSGTDNPPAEGDRPGYAECEVYKLSSGVLKPVPGLTRRVYNLSESSLGQDWITIQRDKFGTWVPVVGGSGAVMAANIVLFRITDAYFCGACTAIAEVIATAYGMGNVPEMDSYDNSITLNDRMGCFLNEPPQALEGRVGTAMYMTSLIEGPCPGMPETGWVITSLCCYEEDCT